MARRQKPRDGVVRHAVVFRECKRLLDKHKVDVPTDLEHIAKVEGVGIFHDAELDWKLASFLYRGPHESGPVIVIGPHPEVAKQRFLIAHELGHFLLSQVQTHVTYRSRAEASKGFGPEDIEANLFATELLMPAALVLKKAGAQYQPSGSRVAGMEHLLVRQSVVNTLAGQFLVSVKAMRYRLASLGFVDAHLYD